MDNTPDIEKLEPTQQGVSEGTQARGTRGGAKKTKKRAAGREVESASGGFIQNLKLRQKLTLIAVALGIPVLGLLTLLTIDLQGSINFAKSERAGVEYLVPLTTAVEKIQLHRGRSAVQLNGDASVQEAREALAAEIDVAIDELERIDQQYGAQFGTSAAVNELVSTWRSVSANHDSLSATESLERHTYMIGELILPLFGEVGNASRLILDPELPSYYTMNLVVNLLPSHINNTGLVRTLGINAVGRETNTPEQRADLILRIGQVRGELGEVERNVNFALEASPFVERELGPAAEEMFAAVGGMLDNYQEQIATVDNPTLEPSDAFSLAIGSFVEQYAFINQAETVLAALLDERISTLTLNRNLILGAVFLALAVAVGLIVLIARQITRPVDELAAVAERVGQGDLSQFAKVNANDELGTLANSFNQAVSSLREASKKNELERQQSEQFQSNVGAFLDVAMDIAEGDFTRRGNVTEDVLGNIVDAINLMVEEVAHLLGQTRNAALSVNEGASEMIATTQSIAQSAERQAAEAQRARAETEQVTDAIRKMAQQADESANASTKALEASRQGEAAVQNTLKGMEGIRTEVQSITERTQSLTRRSEEISGIVRSISRIASQTNLLALSASLEAAGAGEAGKRFATVATEVQTLAEDSANAARQVAGIIRELQSDIRQVTELTESGSKEVETGYKVATEAGQRLREIAEISTQSAELARFISKATQEQVQGVEGVNEIVQTMTEISQTSQGSVSQGRDAAEKLQQLAAQLSESLSRFRLSA